MTSHLSNSVSDLKNFLAVNVNYSNSISKIFLNEVGVELFTKKNETSEICIAPFETNQVVEHSKFYKSKENKNTENLLTKKRRKHENKSINERKEIDSSASVNKFNDNLNNTNSFKVNGSSIGTSKKEFISCSSNYQFSESIESGCGGSRVDTRWMKKEEINFIAVCLVYLISSEKMKFSNLLCYVPTRTKKQFYRHYHGNKTNIQKFSEIFFDYFKFPKKIHIKKGSNKINQLIELFTKKIFDKDFINYFNEKVDDDKCKMYFENTHAFITFEPRNMIKAQEMQKDIYNSPLPKVMSSNRNSSKEIFKNSNISDNVLSSIKLEDDMLVNNLTFKIEEKLFNKLCAFRSGDYLVIDDSCLFEYALKEF